MVEVTAMRRYNFFLIFVLVFSFSASAEKKDKQDKNNNSNSVVERVSADDPQLTAREQEIKLLAREFELREEIKKLEERKKKLEVPSEKKARKEIEKIERFEREFALRESRALINAQITGCEAGTVTVEPRATGSRSFQSHVKLRVTNIHSRPINIEDEDGEIVSNLCPGGALTLFRSREIWTDSNYIQFQYSAKGRFPDGSLGLLKSQWFQLSAYDVSSGRAKQSYFWDVQLQKVYQAQ